MTLVELLVVVAILGLLSVVVLPNLSNPGDARKAREAARAVSGFIANVQSRAIGARSGAGVWIEPLQNLLTDSAGVQHVVAIDLFAAQTPEPYAGEALNSTVAVTVKASGSSAALRFQNGFQLPSSLLNSPNLAIRFASSPASYRLTSVNGSAGSGVAVMDSSRNQTPYTTPWPVADVNPIAYEIYLPATKDPAAALTLGSGMAVDLSWTQLGSLGPPTTTQPSQVLFDSSGRPSRIVRSAGLAEPMVDPVCLLVAPLQMIQENTCFTKPGAYWVAIDPRGGVPRVGEVVLNAANVIASQQYVRQSTFQEGR
jgi:type II secretory pathway pseudopilin PulG